MKGYTTQTRLVLNQWDLENHLSALEALCTEAALEAAARSGERAGHHLYQTLLHLEHEAFCIIADGGDDAEERLEGILQRVGNLFGKVPLGLYANWTRDWREPILCICKAMPGNLIRDWDGTGILAPQDQIDWSCEY